MLTNEQLNEKIATLEATVAQETQQHQAAINEKNQQLDAANIRIAELEAQVSNGGIPDEVGTRLDNLNTSAQNIVP